MFCRDRLLIYGKYCSQVETAIALLDYMCKDKEDVRMKLEVGAGRLPFQRGGGKASRRGPAARRRRRAIDRLFCSPLVLLCFFSPPVTRLAHGSRRIDHPLPSTPPAGMFKESKLRQVHAEGPAGGPHAASLKVPAPLAGTHAVGSANFCCIFFFTSCATVLLFHSLLYYSRVCLRVVIVTT